MASTYSTDLKIELMVTGENAGTWGNKTNDNLNVIQQAIAGYGEQSIAGGAQTTALTIANSPTLSTARNLVVKLTGTITGNQVVTIPNGIEKTFTISNGTVGAFTVEFKTVSGTGATFSTTDKGVKILFSDGTNITAVDLDTLSGEIATAQIEDLAVTSAKLASFAVTSARLASFAITSAKLDTGAVTAIKITQSTITQSKLAANSVGSNQLISTGVTAASYTAASITVDADGRVTSASSGSASTQGMEIPKLYSVGPTSGTYTANANATRAGVYMLAGGGASGFSGPSGMAGGGGGTGGFGFFNKVITQPFSQPFSVGGGGAGGGGTGGAGGNTTIANVGSVNGGNGGSSAVNSGGSGASGNAGSAPGASLTYPVNTFIVGSPFSAGAPPNPSATIPSCPPFTTGQNGSPGNGGVLAVFENIGT